MRSCPVCRSSDHNSQACDACGYSPTSQYLEDQEDSDLLAYLDERESYEGFLDELDDQFDQEAQRYLDEWLESETARFFDQMFEDALSRSIDHYFEPQLRQAAV